MHEVLSFPCCRYRSMKAVLSWSFAILHEGTASFISCNIMARMSMSWSSSAPAVSLSGCDSDRFQIC